MNNLPQTYTIDFHLKDYRNDETVAPDKQVLSYLVYLRCENKHAAIWSQPLQDEDVGTRESFFNVMDMTRQRMLEKLCEEQPNQ